jgi:hypothetical protein
MRRKKKFDKELLNEELKKFQLINEYQFEFYIPEEEDLEKPLDPGQQIIGSAISEEEDEFANDEEGFGGEEEGGDKPSGEEGAEEEGGEEEGFGDAEEEPTDEEGFGDEGGFGDEEPAEEDAVELDVTELVKGSEEAKASADAANSKIDQLMQMVSKLENATQGMDAIGAKIDSLETELEKRAPTEQEKLEMRSLDSAPYNLKLTDFWKDKEGMYDVMGDKEEGEKEYVLKQSDIDTEYSEGDIKDSLSDDNPYEEDEI